MSDRYNGYIVTFEKPIKDEDAQAIKMAILMFKDVIGVEPLVENYISVCMRTQVYWNVKKKLSEVLE